MPATGMNSASALLILIIAALLSGCGGAGNPAVLMGSEDPAPSFADSLSFPQDREIAALSTTTLNGNETAQRSTGAVDDGTAVGIVSAGDLEYALYTFNPNNTPNQVTVTVEESQTSAYWVALANYNKSRWEIDGPFAGSQAFLLNAQHLSALGNFSVAVLAPDSENVGVIMLQLSAENDPPVADLQATANGPAPLTVNFDANGSTDTEGPIAEYEWEYEDGAGFVSTGSTAVSSHNYLTPGTYTATLRVTDSGGLVAFDSVEIVAGEPINSPPNAVLSGPADGPAPFLANFDASASSDPEDGNVSNFRWDIDNDGIFSEAGAEAAAEGVNNISINITQPGTTSVTVEVTDSEGGLGGTDTASDTVVATGWKIFTLANFGDEAGRQNDLAVINGKPAIAFMGYVSSDTPPRSLRYAYSSTDTGSEFADWTTVTTPTFVNGGNSVSLLEVGGNPAITCYGGPTAPTAFRLAYVRSSTASGASPGDWQIIQPDTGGVNFGFASSLAIVSGNPAIAFQGLDENTCYIRSSTATGMSESDWGDTVIIDGVGWSSGSEVSLLVAGGNPAIAYRDQESSLEVRYARANNATGEPATAWTGGGSTKITIESSALFPSMRSVNGNPAIAYWDATNNDLKYAYSTTSSGALIGDWLKVTVDGGADDCGVLPSLAVINGFPAITHQSQGVEFDLEFNRASTATGSLAGDWPADGAKVDTPGDVGGYCSMELVNGFAAVCYFDNTPNGDLKYAVLFE